MRSVFILYENSLFARGLEGLLRQEGIKVIGMAVNDKQALDQIKKFGPDLIIVEAKTGKCEPPIALCQFLIEEKPWRVLRLSLEDNAASLYTCRRWTANTAEELVTGIAGAICGSKQARKVVHA
jgi:chemotaxis response regulator CheB